MLIMWKKNEIDLSRNDGFLGDGLSGLSFCSRQKARCDLLDLPDLLSAKIFDFLIFATRFPRLIVTKWPTIQWDGALFADPDRRGSPPPPKNVGRLISE